MEEKVTRRMDDLGRIVIPKQFRRAMGISEEDDDKGILFELEFKDRMLIVRKCDEE